MADGEGGNERAHIAVSKFHRWSYLLRSLSGASIPFVPSRCVCVVSDREECIPEDEDIELVLDFRVDSGSFE